MIRTSLLAVAALAASAGAASAQYHPTASQPQGGWPPCPPAHVGHADCYCPQQHVFYTTPAPYHVRHVSSGPAVRIYSPPVYVPSGRIDIQGPPIYVEAPPVRVAAPQIYLHAPDVRVKPSQVIVEPPQVHVAPCPGGGACQP
ncbi:hypothetical protein [Phenylobacterium sp.]|uniref:hypothetical protein n=1 Tax=Phenylobacterium sp. TaxID=1871053 RepID=UPI002FD99A28